MNSKLPANILFVITVTAIGFIVFYNMRLSDHFASYISYSYPQVVNLNEADGVGDAPVIIEAEWDNGSEVFFYEESEYGEDAGDNDIVVYFPLDINTCSYEELLLIPKVGDVTAQRIIQYREYLDGYTALEQLMEIKGIAEKTYDLISPYLYVAEEG